MAASVPAVVTVVASNGSMGAFERPARLTMIKPVAPTARPADEPRAPTQMLNVTPSALFAAILTSVQARLSPYLHSQVIVAPKAGVRIEPPAGRVAFTAVRIAIDVRVAASEFSGR